MTTPRKTTTRRTKPADPEIEYEDDHDNIEVVGMSTRMKLFGCLMAVVFFGLFCAMLAAIAFAAWMIYSRDAAPAPAPKPDKIATEFVDAAELARVMVGDQAPLHAIYFSKVCKGVSARLESDFKASAPIIDQRTEAANLFGIVGDFATIPEGTQYKGLEKVIESVGVAVFGKELEGGPLTETDQENLVAAWSELGKAFDAVAQ